MAQERQALAVIAATRARGHLATARARLNRWQEAQSDHIDARAVDLERSALQGRMPENLSDEDMTMYGITTQWIAKFDIFETLLT